MNYTRQNFRTHLSGLLVIFGLILAASVSLVNRSSSPTIQPLIGFIVSLLLLGLSFTFQLNILLRLTLACLIGFLVNQTMMNSFELAIGGYHVTLFGHLPVLALFFLGFYGAFKNNLKEITGMLGYYMIAVGVIFLHMIILFFMLSRAFGFGYENSLEVFVNLIVFSAFLSGLVVFLANKTAYRYLSVVLVFYFFVINLVS